MSEPLRVFVYGSLMRGLKFSHLMNGAELQGTAFTQGAYDLFDLGPYPAASPGGERALCGELYEIDTTILRRLDELEGHPELYRRALRPVSDGSPAWLYEIVRGPGVGERLHQAPRVTGGDWRRWLALRDAI